MKEIVFILLIAIVSMACSDKNVKNWSDKEIDTWFENSGWNNLPIKLDSSSDKRIFVEQNVLNSKSWEAALKFMKNNNFNSMDSGNYELLDDGTYANIAEYITKDSAHFEAHRKFIDIQYLSKGKEFIRVSSLDNPTNQVSRYDESKDIEFFDKNEYTEHLLDGSNFIVLFPKDGHMPCMKVDTNEVVRKIVVKIPFVN